MRALINGIYLAVAVTALLTAALMIWRFMKVPTWNELTRLLVGITLVALGAGFASLYRYLGFVNIPVYVGLLLLIVAGYIFHIRTVTRYTVGAWAAWAAGVAALVAFGAGAFLSA